MMSMASVTEWLKVHWKAIVLVVAGLTVVSFIAWAVRSCDEARRNRAFGAAADAGAAAVKHETSADVKKGLADMASGAVEDAEKRAAMAADAAAGSQAAVKAAIVDAGADIESATKDINGVLR